MTMVELSNKIIDQILRKETPKKEDLATILRAIYTRYMRFYERYFANFDVLNQEEIFAFQKYHEETRSLIKYYYLDIPLDIIMKIEEFDEKCTDDLLGPSWHAHLYNAYEDFREKHSNGKQSEQAMQAAFAKYVLKEFYDSMDYIFRDGFGTESQAAKSVLSGITDLFFKKD